MPKRASAPFWKSGRPIGRISDVEPRLSFVTLGVDDVERSRKFYEALGFKASAASVASSVAFFDAGGVVLALFGREALAKDASVP